MTSDAENRTSQPSPRASRPLGPHAAIALTLAAGIACAGGALLSDTWLFRDTVSATSAAASFMAIWLALGWPIWAHDRTSFAVAMSLAAIVLLAMPDPSGPTMSGRTLVAVGGGLSIGLCGRLLPGELLRRWLLTTGIALAVSGYHFMRSAVAFRF